MKKIITLCVIILLCLNRIFSQDCNIVIDNDRRTCQFQDTLIATPIGGTWKYLCIDTLNVVSFEILNDSSIIVTLSKCGTYTFEYSIIDNFCNVSDTINIDYENPLTTEYFIDLDIELKYDSLQCQDDLFASCGPIQIIGEAPKPIWIFNPKGGTCSGNSYESIITEPIDSCVAQDIKVNLNFNSGTMTSNIGKEFCQEEIMIQQDGMIESDAIFETIFSTVAIGIDSLNETCPSPTQCHLPFPPECIDSVIYDTIELFIPVHLGGYWSVLSDSGLISLDTNNIFTIDSINYSVVVSPSPQNYSATFNLKELLANGDTILPTEIVTLDLQWTEIWTTDTIWHIDSSYVISDSCCHGGAIINYPIEIPEIPEYNCSPFSITFLPGLVASEPNVVCDDSVYTIEIELANGIPPYNYLGNSGTLVGNVFTSDSIPIDSINYIFEFNDSGGCEASIDVDVCPCLWGGNTPSYEIAWRHDCEGNSIGKLEAIYFTESYPPFQFSIDGINFQSNPEFSNLPIGIYEYTVKDRFNCLVTNEISIENEKFWSSNIDESISSFTVCEGEEVLLEASPPSQYNYHIWDNGDSNFQRSVDEPGLYFVETYDLLQCVIWKNEFEVNHLPNPTLYSNVVPNVFTPDSDGVNDSFSPIIDPDFTIQSYNVTIFNRWGQRVFQTNDKNEKWQPKEESTLGVYVYFVEMELIDCFGEVIYFKDSGDLTLIK